MCVHVLRSSAISHLECMTCMAEASSVEKAYGCAAYCEDPSLVADGDGETRDVDM